MLLTVAARLNFSKALHDCSYIVIRTSQSSVFQIFVLLFSSP